MGTMVRQHYWRKLSRYDKILLLIFLFSLPLVNPWVRGDGVGYYAYARALVVNGNLRFEPDWLHSNASFFNGHVNSEGEILSADYTPTAHLDNHFTIGPALDWMPFLFLTHLAVRGFDFAGGHIPPDGFSWPYTYTMALVTAAAGFFGLMLSFSLARNYFSERWAFLATLGIWLASSLPVYMYFNPSWSHAHSAFVVALFLWYWDRTRSARAVAQWIVLGLIAGLMLDVYYPNAVILLVLVVELAILLGNIYRSRAPNKSGELFSLLLRGSLFAAALVFAFLPTLISRWVIYGNAFATGYTEVNIWRLTNPLWGQVLFSSNHGLFSWTPILLLATVGLPLVLRRDRVLGSALLVSAFAYYFLIATYPNWNGISSFGNRFFVSLTSLFVLGLAALSWGVEEVMKHHRAVWQGALTVIAILAIWNLGLIYQWGMHLIPDRGPISWGEMVSNQFRVVPVDLPESVVHYFTQRHSMMQGIEKRDLQQLREQDSKQNGGKPGS